jgi:hypothetical protein
VARPRSRRKSTPSGRRRPRTIVTTETTTAKKPNAKEPQTQPQQPASKPQIVKITLDEIQSRILEPLLSEHRRATEISGLLCVVSKSFRPSEGSVTIELQIIPASQRAIAALEKIAGLSAYARIPCVVLLSRSEVRGGLGWFLWNCARRKRLCKVYKQK